MPDRRPRNDVQPWAPNFPEPSRLLLYQNGATHYPEVGYTGGTAAVQAAVSNADLDLFAANHQAFRSLLWIESCQSAYGSSNLNTTAVDAWRDMMNRAYDRGLNLIMGFYSDHSNNAGAFTNLDFINGTTGNTATVLGNLMVNILTRAANDRFLSSARRFMVTTPNEVGADSGGSYTQAKCNVAINTFYNLVRTYLGSNYTILISHGPFAGPNQLAGAYRPSDWNWAYELHDYSPGEWCNLGLGSYALLGSASGSAVSWNQTWAAAKAQAAALTAAGLGYPSGADNVTCTASLSQLNTDFNAESYPMDFTDAGHAYPLSLAMTQLVTAKAAAIATEIGIAGGVVDGTSAYQYKTESEWNTFLRGKVRAYRSNNIGCFRWVWKHETTGSQGSYSIIPSRAAEFRYP